MTYSDFDLATALEKFNLSEEREQLFAVPIKSELSPWLKESLAIGVPLALAGLEKARSEFIIAPILLELNRRHLDHLALHSGKRLDVNRELGLTGECDFILATGKTTHIIRTPILVVVEAKKDDIEQGLGQCLAQMVAVQMLNQQADEPIATVYGCVTTGEVWQFLQLVAQKAVIDADRYYLNQVELILGIFEAIVTHYL